MPNTETEIVIKSEQALEPLAAKAIEIIQQIQYLNIGSITPEGLPWTNPVLTAFDKNLHFFWVSWKQNQHSVNVRNNPNVYCTIYDSTVPPGTGVGVYLQGKAKELHNPLEIIPKLLVFYQRRGKQPRDVVEFLTHFPRRVYEFTPERFWINGEGAINGNFIDIRTELPKGLLLKTLSADL